jgi:hypothetical protein
VPYLRKPENGTTAMPCALSRHLTISLILVALLGIALTPQIHAQTGHPYLAPEQFPWEDLSDLTRGHRLHILYGLQLSGWCDPEGVGEHNGVWNPARWVESNLTTPTWNGGYAPDFVGTAPGNANWGHWGRSVVDATLYPDEQAYLDTLVLLQYRDESKLDDPAIFDENVEIMHRYQQELPHAISFIDLHGSQVMLYSFFGQLANFMSQGRPDMLVMNDYLFNGTNTYVTGGTPISLWTSMAFLRSACLAGYSGTGADPIPAGQFLQTCTDSGNSHIITESELNLYVFSSLAYGFKTLIAYRYADSPSVTVSSVLLSGTGYNNPTPAFYYFADAIAQARNLGPALVRLQSTNIAAVPGYYNNFGSKSPIPVDTNYTPLWNASLDPYTTGVTVQNLGSENSGYEGSVLFGYFRPLDESFDGAGYENEQYFMVVNSLSSVTADEAACRQRIQLNFDFGDSGITELLRVSRATGELEVVPLQHLGGTQYRLDFELGGGMGDLFKFDTGAPFVGMDGPWTDADADGLADAWESATGSFVGEYDAGTSAAVYDSDRDGLSDGAEVNVYGTNPLVADSDGDSVSDGDEVHVHGTDPANAESVPELPAATTAACLLLAAIFSVLLVTGLRKKELRITQPH